MVSKEKLKKLEQQIDSLQSKKLRIENRRKDQIIKILDRCNASSIPDEILAGAIFEASKAYHTKDSRIQAWKEQGSKITNPGRGRRRKDSFFSDMASANAL